MQRHAMPALLGRFAAAGSYPGLQHVHDCGKRISFLNQQVRPSSQCLQGHMQIMTGVLSTSTLQPTGENMCDTLITGLQLYPLDSTGS